MDNYYYILAYIICIIWLNKIGLLYIDNIGLIIKAFKRIINIPFENLYIMKYYQLMLKLI